MAKKTIPKKIKKEIVDYVNILKTDKLPIQSIILFGSYAKRTQNKWSDIDLCIVSPKFKNHFEALQYLWLKRAKNTGLTIEPVGFHPKDFQNKYDSLIQEIKQTGIKLKSI